jgi:hypothetical protein
MTQLYYPQFPINYPAPSIRSSSEMDELLMQLHLSSMKLDSNQKPTPTVNTQSAVQPSTSPRSPSSEFTRYAGGAFEQSPDPENLPLPSFIKKRPTLELSKSADAVSGPTSFSSESLSASDEELSEAPLSHSQTRSPSRNTRRSKRAQSPYKGYNSHSPARSNKSQQQH